MSRIIPEANDNFLSLMMKRFINDLRQHNNQSEGAMY